jgi:hypothetical protein
MRVPSGGGSSDADVVEVSIDAQGDCTGGDAVGSNAWLVVCWGVAGVGFGAGGVDDGRCGVV